MAPLCKCNKLFNGKITIPNVQLFPIENKLLFEYNLDGPSVDKGDKAVSVQKKMCITVNVISRIQIFSHKGYFTTPITGDSDSFLGET